MGYQLAWQVVGATATVNLYFQEWCFVWTSGGMQVPARKRCDSDSGGGEATWGFELSAEACKHFRPFRVRARRRPQ